MRLLPAIVNPPTKEFGLLWLKVELQQQPAGVVSACTISIPIPCRSSPVGCLIQSAPGVGHGCIAYI